MDKQGKWFTLALNIACPSSVYYLRDNFTLRNRGVLDRILRLIDILLRFLDYLVSHGGVIMSAVSAFIISNLLILLTGFGDDSLDLWIRET